VNVLVAAVRVFVEARIAIRRPFKCCGDSEIAYLNHICHICTCRARILLLGAGRVLRLLVADPQDQ
jgi:hypothetical protein